MPRLVPKRKRPDDAPPLPLSLREVEPAYVVVRGQDLYDPETRHTFEAGKRIPLGKAMRRFVVDNAHLCEIGFRTVPADPGWAIAFDAWASERETTEEKQRKAEQEARRKEAEEQARRDVEFLESERRRVEKWNKETAARSAREREEARNKIRADYDLRAAELEAELEEAEA